MNKTKIKFNFLIAIFVAIVLLLMSSIAALFISPNKVSALTDTSKAVKAGNGAELYDATSGTFDKNVMADLIEKLFGSDDPIEYIKTMKDTQTDSYVIPAPTLNTRAGSTAYGMVLTLGGMEWSATSLTIADIENREEAVLTLYLANANGNSKYYSSNINVKGNNSYSRSIIRNQLLTDPKWDLFNGTEQNGFASQFLVQPKYIKYQHNQTQIGRGTYVNHLANEALDEFKTGWSSSLSGAYKPSDTFPDPNGDLVRYDAWGEDYIWLPSMSETGSANRQSTSSIWRLSTSQLAHNVKSMSWFRTGDVSTFMYGYSLVPSGDCSSAYCNDELGIRPAIHLNLTELIAAVNNQPADPQDLTSTFNEKGQTIKSIATNSKASWYDKDVYEHADEYIKITYPNKETALTNAGEYWVKFEITQNYFSAVDEKVDKEGAENGWSEDYIAQAKERRKPKFRGSPNTTDPYHIETDTIRWIKVTINKAEIDFSKIEWTADKFEYNATNQSVTIKEGILSENIFFKYNNNLKTAVGKYTAQVVEVICSNNNYKVPASSELSKYPTLKHDWEITKKKIQAVWKLESKTQDGVTIIVPVLEIAENLKNSVEYKYYTNQEMTDEISLDEIFSEIDMSEPKTYWVKATLKDFGDFNNTNCVFVLAEIETAELSTIMQTGSSENSVQVQITNSKVTFNNNEQSAKFSLTGGGLTESALVLSYFTANGTPLQTAPKNEGIYKVKVQLKDELTNFILIGQTEFEFEIESLKVTKPNANQVQFFQAEGFELKDIANLPKDWQNYFDIKVYDKDNNEILAVNNNWNFVNVNEYRIEIIFKNGTNMSNGGVSNNVIWSDTDKSTFTVKLEIMPLVFIMEGWQDSTTNKRPTLICEDSSEIGKYFDYIIYELKNETLIGNMLPENASLKYKTNYQISLKVKNEFNGNVFVECNGEIISETEPYKFTTIASSNGGNGSDGDSEDGDSNGGNSGGSHNSGIDAWFGEGGKLPIFAWILVGVVLLMLILMIIIIIMLIRNKKQPPQQVITNVHPYEENADKDSNKVIKDESKSISGTIVNNYKVGYKDWTFVLKETDILNLKALEWPQDEIMFYAFKKNDLRKIDKLKEKIEEIDDIENSDKLNKDKAKNKSKKVKSKKH